MPTLVNGKVTYAAGEALPAVGSQAYINAQKGVLPTTPTNTSTPTPTPATVAPSSVPAGWSPTAWAQQQADMAKYFPTVPTNTNPTSPTTPTNTGTSQGGNPTTPSSGQPLSTITTPVSSSETSNELLDRLLKSLTPSSDETALQTKLSNIEASRRLSYQNLEGQAIATPFISGQETAVNKGLQNEEQNISGQLSNMQSNRNATTTALTTALGIMKPTTLAAGSELVNPFTGKVIAGAGGAADKQAMDTFYNLQQTYPDAGIVYDTSKSWQENLTMAQQKASKSPSFQAKNTVYAINPLTGEPTVVSKMGGASGWDASSGGTSLGASSGSAPAGGSLDVGASGGAVTALQNWLIQQGYSIPAGATGYYGAQTQAAVAAFQKAAGVDTSGGGVGTFGPKTQVAAASKGFSLGGGGSSGGSSSGTPAPSMSVNQLAPELQTAYQNLGGVQFFDASKVTSGQLPYLQRAAQATGIPLLTKEDANAIQTSYQAIRSSDALVTEINTLVGNVINAPNDQVSMTKQAAYLTAVEKAPSLFTDNDAKAFISARNSVLSLITRAAGEKGTLTDRDVARISAALPSFGDNKDLAAQKARNLSAVLQSVFQGSVQAYIGQGSTSSGGASGGSTYKGYTLPN